MVNVSTVSHMFESGQASGTWGMYFAVYVTFSSLFVGCYLPLCILNLVSFNKVFVNISRVGPGQYATSLVG
jgi:hypothetical protein